VRCSLDWRLLSSKFWGGGVTFGWLIGIVILFVGMKIAAKTDRRPAPWKSYGPFNDAPPTVTPDLRIEKSSFAQNNLRLRVELRRHSFEAVSTITPELIPQLQNAAPANSRPEPWYATSATRLCIPKHWTNSPPKQNSSKRSENLRQAPRNIGSWACRLLPPNSRQADWIQQHGPFSRWRPPIGFSLRRQAITSGPKSWDLSVPSRCCWPKSKVLLTAIFQVEIFS